MTIPLILPAEFIGGIEMEMARVVSFLCLSRVTGNSEKIKDSLKILSLLYGKRLFFSTAKTLYVVKTPSYL